MISNMDWYAPVLRRGREPDPWHISFGDRQCNEWILANARQLEQGKWPDSPWGNEYNGEAQRILKSNGPFTTAVEFIAEVERRLKLAGDDGHMARLYFEGILDMKDLVRLTRRYPEWIEKRCRRALNYISKADMAKRPTYKYWCGHGRVPKL